MNTGIIIFIAVLAYGIACVLISIRGKKSSGSGVGFFLGGRSFGIVITVCSVVMGIYSALAFYGFPPMIMRQGAFSNAAAGFGCVGLAYPLIGYRLWKMGKGRGYVTTSDFLRERFYSESFGVLVALLQLIFIIPYITLQFVAIGNGLSISSGGQVPYVAAIIIFGVFSAIYIVIGGAKGLGLMDIFNAMLALIIPLIACVVVVKNAFGGDWALMGSTAMEAFPDINHAAAFGHTYDPINVLSMVITGVLATFASPHIVSKLYMAKDRKTFQKMTYTGSLGYTVMSIPIIMLGIIGTALYKIKLGDSLSDSLVPTMMLEHTNIFIVIGMLWVLFAFATSTTNAFTISGASILSRDLVGRFGFKNVKDPEQRDRLSVKVGKIGVIIMVGLTILAALTKPAYLVDYAYKFASPGFAQALPALILGMYWKRATKEGAFAGTIGGIVTLVITLFIIKSPLGINPVMWALGVNFLLFFVVSFCTQPRMDVVKDFFPEPKCEIAK